jgi:squalene cyclase
MIDRTRFEAIKQRHGRYASWAVWAEASDRPKSNIGDLSIFDPEANGSLLDTLKGDVILVGLNLSVSTRRTVSELPRQEFEGAGFQDSLRLQEHRVLRRLHDRHHQGR